MTGVGGGKWNPGRRSSLVGLRSEYSDMTLRSNNQEENRLQLKHQEYDKAKAQLVNELAHQRKVLQTARLSDRRASSPGIRYEEMKNQLDTEKVGLEEKLKSFMIDTKKFTKGDMPESSSSESLASPPNEFVLYGSNKETTKSEESLTKTDDEVDSVKSKRSKHGSPPKQGDLWKNLSAPKHQKTPIRNLRAQISDSLRVDAHAVGASPRPLNRPKLQVSPVMPRRVRRSIDMGSVKGGNMLTVPTNLYQSHSSENLSSRKRSDTEPYSRGTKSSSVSPARSPAVTPRAVTPVNLSPRLGRKAKPVDITLTLPSIVPKS